jgi:hypothetical protein
VARTAFSENACFSRILLKVPFDGDFFQGNFVHFRARS